MKEMRAESLSPIDTATLWPQLGRLSTEVVAVRSGEHLLLNSALAATGLARLPRMPRTAVIGIRRGLSYRGVLVAKELSGGAGWEVESLRIARDKDDEAVTALLAATGSEVARRGGRTLYMRLPQGSPHGAAVRKGGLMVYTEEHLFAMLRTKAEVDSGFRPATRQDRHGIFRLYCRVVPENVRRQEAPTQQDWRAIHDSFDCDRQLVLDGEGALAAWIGFGGREVRLLADSTMAPVVDEALDVAEAYEGRHNILVAMQYQFDVQRIATDRGYTELGTRLLCARRLAVFNPLKEVVAVPADSVPLPH
jgi:hypothetical protein